MTRPRVDDHSTEFGLWLRQQSEIDSGLGFLASNLDYIWRSYLHPGWALLEEKRHSARLKDWQRETFQIVDAAARSDPNYRGFWIVRFENTCPDDGRTWLCHDYDANEVTGAEMIAFLRDIVK